MELIGIVPEDETVGVGSNRGQPVAMDGKSKQGRLFTILPEDEWRNSAFMKLEQKEDIFKKLARMMRRDERTGG